jgi:hypothetical protein
MPRSNDGRWTANCEVCGKEFQQRRPGQRTCGVVCRAQLPHNTGGSRAKAGLEPRVCQNPECGKTFQPVRDNQISCNRTCLLKCPSYIEAQRRTDRRPERQARSNQLRRPSNPEANPDRIKTNRTNNRRHQLAQYGVTPEQYNQALEDQNGVCMICGQPPKPDGTRAASCLHQDHDHTTGVPRDLLCGTCNQGLGFFKDDPVLLRAAADYIERHRAGVLV